MKRKNTLLIVDGDCVKIIFGNKLKCIKFSDVGLDYNADFLEAIFHDTEVVKVDSISRVTRDDLGNFLQSKTKVPRTEAPRQKSPQQASSQVPRERVSDPITSPGPKDTMHGFMPQDGGEVYVVSTDDRMTIIVDDVYTGRKVAREGMSEDETLVLEPGKPVRLSSLEEKSVQKSAQGGILGRLLRNGTVRQISHNDSLAMLRAYEEKASQVLSALDWRSGGSNMVGDGTPGSAAKFASSVVAEDLHVAQTIDVTSDDMAPRPGFPGTLPQSGPSDELPDISEGMVNEDSNLMSDLMDSIDESEASGELKPQRKPFTGFRSVGGA